MTHIVLRGISVKWKLRFYEYGYQDFTYKESAMKTKGRSENASGKSEPGGKGGADDAADRQLF